MGHAELISGFDVSHHTLLDVQSRSNLLIRKIKPLQHFSRCSIGFHSLGGLIPQLRGPLSAVLHFSCIMVLMYSLVLYASSSLNVLSFLAVDSCGQANVRAERDKVCDWMGQTTRQTESTSLEKP